MRTISVRIEFDSLVEDGSYDVGDGRDFKGNHT